MRKTSLFIFFVAFLVSEIVNANNAWPRVEEILYQVVDVNGHLDKRLHQEFWHEINKIGSTEEVNKAVDTLRISLLFGQEYQIEMWKSFLLSYRKSTVVKTKRMIVLGKQMTDNFKNSIQFEEGSYQYNEMLRGFNKRDSSIKEDTEKFLLAAANNETLQFSGREDFIPSEESINFVLNNINGSFERVQKLLNKDWGNTRVNLDQNFTTGYDGEIPLDFAFFLGMLIREAASLILFGIAYIAYCLINKKKIGTRIVILVGIGLVYTLFSGWLTSVYEGSYSLQLHTTILPFLAFMIDVGIVFLIAKIINFFNRVETKN